MAFVVLPVLPNRCFGPYNVLNPYNIWLMVVLVAGINLASYLALKLVGTRAGASPPVCWAVWSRHRDHLQLLARVRSTAL